MRYETLAITVERASTIRRADPVRQVRCTLTSPSPPFFLSRSRKVEICVSAVPRLGAEIADFHQQKIFYADARSTRPRTRATVFLYLWPRENSLHVGNERKRENHINILYIDSISAILTPLRLSSLSRHFLTSHLNRGKKDFLTLYRTFMSPVMWIS